MESVIPLSRGDGAFPRGFRMQRASRRLWVRQACGPMGSSESRCIAQAFPHQRGAPTIYLSAPVESSAQGGREAAASETAPPLVSRFRRLLHDRRSRRRACPYSDTGPEPGGGVPPQTKADDARTPYPTPEQPVERRPTHTRHAGESRHLSLVRIRFSRGQETQGVTLRETGLATASTCPTMLACEVSADSACRWYGGCAKVIRKRDIADPGEGPRPCRRKGERYVLSLPL